MNDRDPWRTFELLALALFGLALIVAVILTLASAGGAP